MSEPTPPYTPEELASDAVSKKDLVSKLQELGSSTFLFDHKLKGAAKNVVKTKTKEQLVADLNELFELKAFKKEGEDEEEKVVEKVTKETAKLSVKDKKDDKPEVPKYKKVVLKKGKGNFPKKGDSVGCFYTGKLTNGTVFDSNVVTGRKAKSAQPLRFKVGKGAVIRGWDEALLTMSLGEKAELTIEPEWAYGRRGVEGKIPPNSTLIFEVDLAEIA